MGSVHCDSGEGVERASGLPTGAADLTFYAWMRVVSYAVGDFVQGFSLASGSGPPNLGIDSDESGADTLDAFLYDGALDTVAISTGGSTSWVWVAFVHVGGTLNWTVYSRGELDGALTNLGTLSAATVEPLFNTFRIGHDAFGSPGNADFKKAGIIASAPSAAALYAISNNLAYDGSANPVDLPLADAATATANNGTAGVFTLVGTPVDSASEPSLGGGPAADAPPFEYAELAEEPRIEERLSRRLRMPPLAAAAQVDQPPRARHRRRQVDDDVDTRERLSRRPRVPPLVAAAPVDQPPRTRRRRPLDDGVASERLAQRLRGFPSSVDQPNLGVWASAEEPRQPEAVQRRRSSALPSGALSDISVVPFAGRNVAQGQRAAASFLTATARRVNAAVGFAAGVALVVATAAAPSRAAARASVANFAQVAASSAGASPGTAHAVELQLTTSRAVRASSGFAPGATVSDLLAFAALGAGRSRGAPAAATIIGQAARANPRGLGSSSGASFSVTTAGADSRASGRTSTVVAADLLAFAAFGRSGAAGRGAATGFFTASTAGRSRASAPVAGASFLLSTADSDTRATGWAAGTQLSGLLAFAPMGRTGARGFAGLTTLAASASPVLSTARGAIAGVSLSLAAPAGRARPYAYASGATLAGALAFAAPAGSSATGRATTTNVSLGATPGSGARAAQPASAWLGVTVTRGGPSSRAFTHGIGDVVTLPASASLGHSYTFGHGMTQLDPTNPSGTFEASGDFASVSLEFIAAGDFRKV
jgi:hypothetical protein